MRSIEFQPRIFLLWSYDSSILIYGSSLALRKKDVVSGREMFIFRANRKEKTRIIIGRYGM